MQDLVEIWLLASYLNWDKLIGLWYDYKPFDDASFDSINIWKGNFFLGFARQIFSLREVRQL